MYSMAHRVLSHILCAILTHLFILHRTVVYLFMNAVFVSLYSFVVVPAFFHTRGEAIWPQVTLFAQILKILGEPFRRYYLCRRCMKVMEHTSYNTLKGRQIIQIGFAIFVAGNTAAQACRYLLDGRSDIPISGTDPNTWWQVPRYSNIARQISTWADSCVDIFTCSVIVYYLLVEHVGVATLATRMNYVL